MARLKTEVFALDGYAVYDDPHRVSRGKHTSAIDHVIRRKVARANVVKNLWV